MKKVVLITGANGMLAQHLGNQLESQHTVRYLTRRAIKSNEYQWDLNKNYIDPKALIDVHCIIHLAGAPIANTRWTTQKKQAILSSRVDTAKLLLDTLKKHKLTIEAFISASAIGYYGTTTTDIIYDEESPKGNDFLSEVCEQWEKAAHDFKTHQVARRVAIVRLGVILAKNDGILNNLVPTIRKGFGSGIGSGKQYIPWVHIKDLAGIFKLLLNNPEISGTFNAVSPEHVTNKTLVKKIAKALNKNIWLPNAPEFIIRLLFGEAAVLILEGSRISSDKIINQGFHFEYRNLGDALNDLL